MSLEKIWSAILAVEEAESLPSWRVGDVYLWQVIRERLFTHIAEQLGLYQPVPAKDPIPQQREVPIQQSAVAVLPFVRRDANGSDPFSAGIIAAAEKANCEFVFSEDMNPGQTYRGVMLVNPFLREDI